MPAGSIFCNNCGAKVPVNPTAPAKFVDLGLPSGTLWATCNEGANKPEDYGYHYNFYEVISRKFPIPTKEQFAELLDKCTHTWTTKNGVWGRLFTGPNDKSIFLPAAGYRHDSEFRGGVGRSGQYWSNTGTPYGASWYLYFDSDNCSMDNYGYRGYGQSVRPVCVSAQN